MLDGLYNTEHEAFRDSVREFIRREVAPHLERWDTAGIIDRSVWRIAGSQGFIGFRAPSEFGGGGTTDYRYRNIVQEELAKVCAGALNSGFGVQDDIVIPYLVSMATPAQQRRWLPALCEGERIGAVAMTEPGAGSDLRGIRTMAREVSGGWILNGSKMFITSGIHADLVVVLGRHDPSGDRPRYSLFVVERDMPGFARGHKLDKIGLLAQDTAELSFADVFVPSDNLLGEEGAGLRQLMTHLPLERLSIATTAMASADAAFDWTLAYVNSRTAFGRTIADMPTTRFTLAEVSAELEVTRAFINDAVAAVSEGALGADMAARAKLWATEMQGRTLDKLLQLFGGYGYMREYPIARAWADARVQRIYGGTSEIMKQIIARDVLGRR